MTEDRDSSHGNEQADKNATEPTARATEARDSAQQVAERLADTANDLAVTMDHLAEARDRLAETTQIDPGRERHLAQRARNAAEGERQDSRELREKWDLPPAQ